MSYRQLCFWLRDHNNSRQYHPSSWSKYQETNRSIWCESDNRFETVDQVRKCAGVETFLVAERSHTNRNWYPNDRPFGVMRFLKIKKVL